MSQLIHGGDIQSAAALYGHAPESWLDLSTGINAHSYLVPKVSQQAWHQLPYLSTDLQNAANNYYGNYPCLASNGSQPIIELLPKILRSLGNSNKAWLPDIGYQEHLHAWHKQGLVSTYSGLDHGLAEQQINQAIANNDIGHLVIINPNNPTGMRFSLAQLQGFAVALKAKAGFLVIDEAFIDTHPNHSMLQGPLADNLVVLRSVGKFFGLAGMRLGFTFANDKVLRALDNAIGPWAVNGPAQEVASCALNDKPWQDQMRSQLIKQMPQQQDLWHTPFTRIGGEVCACHELYRSYKLAPNIAQKLQQSAAKNGILLRLITINTSFSLLRLGNVNLSDKSALERCHTWIQQEF